MPSVSLAVACRGTAVYDACRSRRNCGRQLRAAAVRQRRPRLERRRADALVVKAGLTEVAEAGAVNVLLGAVAFQWIGMAALVAAAPLYRDKMKEKPDWNTIHGALTEAGGVEAVQPDQAKSVLRRGAVLLDIRTEAEAERAPLEKATSIPMYRALTGNDIFTNAKRVVFAWNGKAGTELDPEWLSRVEKAIPKGKQVVVVCNQGGSLDTKSGNKFGFPSRSLKAVYFLKEAGYKRVTHVAGGAFQLAKLWG